MSEKIRILVVRVGEEPVVEEIDRGLDSMQKIVEGYVECVGLEDGVDVWCNEEGLYTKPFNRDVPARAPMIPEGAAFVIEVRGPDDPPFAKPGEWGVHSIHGTFFLARHDGEGETTSLNDDDIARWSRILSLKRAETPKEAR